MSTLRALPNGVSITAYLKKMIIQSNHGIIVVFLPKPMECDATHCDLLLLGDVK